MNNPRQFGPSIRIPPPPPCDAASSAAWKPSPSPPTSANPAVNTIAAFVPSADNCPTASIASAVGTAITAASGTRGSSAMLRYARTPWTSARFGLTGRISPRKPWLSM